MKNYYQILEVSERATQDEIKKQYRFLLQAWHPDKFSTPEQKEKAEEKIKEINEAYSVLGNPAKRKAYDDQMKFRQEQPFKEEARSTTTSGFRQEDSNSDDKHDLKTDIPSQSKRPPRILLAFVGIVSILLCLALFSFADSLNSATISQSPSIVLITDAKLITPSPIAVAVPTSTTENLNRFQDIDDMVLVTEGEFAMGRDDGASNERPVHSVFLDQFFIDKYEVTNLAYRKCVLSGICMPPVNALSFSTNYFDNSEFDAHPVVYVTWSMANTFCKWRGGRLPTEAEWEKAARGSDSRLYPWGNEFQYGFSNICDVNCPHEWADKNYDDGYPYTAPVGSFPQGESPYGVSDMSGNVYEWVADWLSEDYYSVAPYANPTGPDFGKDKVIRGGAWGDSGGTTITSRASFNPESAYEFLGFRCARDVSN